MCSVKRLQSKADFITKNVATIFKPDKIWRLLDHGRLFLSLFRIICMNFHKTENLVFPGCSWPGQYSRDHLVPAAGLCQFPTIWNIPHPNCWFLATTKYYQSLLRHQWLFKYSNIRFLLPSFFIALSTPLVSEGLVTSLNKSDMREATLWLIISRRWSNKTNGHHNGLGLTTQDHNNISSEPRAQSQPTDSAPAACVTQPSQRRPPGVSIF